MSLLCHMCQHVEVGMLTDKASGKDIQRPELDLLPAFFLIAGIPVIAVQSSLWLLPEIVPLFLAFLLLAALIAKVMTRLMGLPIGQGPALAFSLGTRNAFVVLPFALSLPTA